MSNLETLYQQVLSELGEDTNREGLLDTPKRAAKAMQFLTSGYETNLHEVVNNAVFTSDNDEMVVVQGIEFYSLCEHHMLPFIGRCHIGYLPNGNVLGLSKFARITDMFARRLQIQENMTKQIAEAVEEITGCRGVGVIVEAQLEWWIWPIFLYSFGILAAIDALWQGRTSQGTIAWVLALLLMPALSLPFYLFFGSRRFQAYRRARRHGDDRISATECQARNVLAAHKCPTNPITKPLERLFRIGRQPL